jgi:hypothetical protein
MIARSGLGHERRLLLWMAAHRLPLFSVCDRSHAAVQNDAMGQTRSFDHLVGDGKQRRWDHETEAFGGSKADDELEPRGLLDGKISRLRALRP